MSFIPQWSPTVYYNFGDTVQFQNQYWALNVSGSSTIIGTPPASPTWVITTSGGGVVSINGLQGVVDVSAGVGIGVATNPLTGDIQISNLNPSVVQQGIISLGDSIGATSTSFTPQLVTNVTSIAGSPSGSFSVVNTGTPPTATSVMTLNLNIPPPPTAVASVSAGTGISVSGTTNVTVTNDGVLDLTAGSGISITGTKANYTISNSFPSTTSFSYNYYVSNISGNDITGDGNISNPYQTITKALAVAGTIADSNPVIINLACGTYTENITINRNNTYITGGSTSLSSATVINGSVTIDMTSSSLFIVVGGLSSVQVTNIIYQNSVAKDQNYIVTDCIIVPGNGVSGIELTDTSVGGNGNMTVQNSIVYMSDTTAVSVSNSRISFINTQITNNPGLANATVSMVVTSGTGGVNMFGTSVIQNSTSSTVQPLVDITNSVATGSVMTLNNAILTYTSATSDSGTGAKCCVRFSNSASVSMNMINNLLTCIGATTGSPNIQSVQKTGAGTVSLNYGDNQVIGPAYYIASGVTKTPMTQISQGSFASFSSSVTQPVTGANTTTPLTYNTTDLNTGGYTQSGASIRVTRAGNYEIIPSIQFDKTGGGTALIFFWIQTSTNNSTWTDVPNSSSAVNIASSGNSLIGTVSIIVSLSALQYVRVVMSSSDAGSRALFYALSATTPPHPANPSVITTIKLLV